MNKGTKVFFFSRFEIDSFDLTGRDYAIFQEIVEPRRRNCRRFYFQPSSPPSYRVQSCVFANVALCRGKKHSNRVATARRCKGNKREREGGIFTQRAFMTFKLSTGGYTRGNREFRGYTRESAIITSSILSLLGTGL